MSMMILQERERERVCVCVCVREREREKRVNPNNPDSPDNPDSNPNTIPLLTLLTLNIYIHSYDSPKLPLTAMAVTMVSTVYRNCLVPGVLQSKFSESMR